jgi:hypothetical protein
MRLFTLTRSPIGRSLRRSALLSAVSLLAVIATHTPQVLAQAGAPADAGGVNIYAGLLASSFTLRYREQKIQGAAAFIDIAGKSPLGLEAEARWLAFPATQNVHIATRLIGPRYRWKRGRYQVYVKGLAGVGSLAFADQYARGSHVVFAPGGGIDFRPVGRLYVRLVDVEYQYWPDLAAYPWASYGLSAGLRYRIF